MSGIHSPMGRDLFTLKGAVRTEGGSKNLSKGEFAIVNKSKPTANGATVVSSFAGLPKSTVYELRVGKSPVSEVRSGDTSTPYKSHTFTIEDVKDIRVSAPKITVQKFDDLIIGYDGINDSSALVINEGASTVIDLLLYGDPIKFLNNSDKYGEYKVKLHLTKEVGETDQEVVQKAVKRLLNEKLPTQVPITDLIKVKIVDSSNVNATNAWVFSTLTLTDGGTSNDLAVVQAQYPNYRVERTNRVGLTSTYTILHPSSVVLDDYVVGIPSYIKDCKKCMEGFDEVVSGFGYSISLQDDGEDLGGTIGALPGFISAVKAGQAVDDSGKGLYSVVINHILTNSEITAFLETGAIESTATIKLIGELPAICHNKKTATFDWVTDNTCFASTAQYQLQLKDDDCDKSRLVELQLAYPDLVIKEEVSPIGGCQRIYTTTVATNVICPDCDPIFTELWTSTAPADFDFIPWTLVPIPSDENAKMGIRITAKPFILDPSEALRDVMPFMETSVRIKVAGGYIEEPNWSNEPVYENGIFKVKLLNRAQDRDHLGGNLKYREDMSRTYFNGTSRHLNNLVAKALLGEESVLDNRKQYVDYTIVIKDNKYSQGVGKSSDMGISYIVHAEVGLHVPLENLVNELASRAGLDVVQAYPNP